MDEMVRKMNEKFNKLYNYLNSNEGKVAFEKYMEEKYKIEQIHKTQLKRFHEKYSYRFQEIINKVITKYRSDKYASRWYNRNIEPPETLYYFLYDYVEKYGRKATEEEYEKYASEFCDGLYFFDGYFFEYIVGQGTAILIYKKEDDER